MGNQCCGGDDFPAPRGGERSHGHGHGHGQGQSHGQKAYTASGAAPPSNMMTPDEDERREQQRKAAEERARQNAVRGTQRYNPKRKPKVPDYDNLDSKGGPDISDWT